MPGPPEFTKSVSFPSAFRVARFRLPNDAPGGRGCLHEQIVVAASCSPRISAPAAARKRERAEALRPEDLLPQVLGKAWGCHVGFPAQVPGLYGSQCGARLDAAQDGSGARPGARGPSGRPATGAWRPRAVSLNRDADLATSRQRRRRGAAVVRAGGAMAALRRSGLARGRVTVGAGGEGGRASGSCAEDRRGPGGGSLSPGPVLVRRRLRAGLLAGSGRLARGVAAGALSPGRLARGIAAGALCPRRLARGIAAGALAPRRLARGLLPGVLVSSCAARAAARAALAPNAETCRLNSLILMYFMFMRDSCFRSQVRSRPAGQSSWPRSSGSSARQGSPYQ